MSDEGFQFSVHENCLRMLRPSFLCVWEGGVLDCLTQGIRETFFTFFFFFDIIFVLFNTWMGSVGIALVTEMS